MKRIEVDIAVIGAGPAGLSAALEADRLGKSVVLLERSDDLGGILQQCIHDGFGLLRFKQQLSGPQYAQRFIDQLKDSRVQLFSGSMVLSSENKMILAANPVAGMIEIYPQAIILAMGCRERTRNQIQIMGTRPAGIMTAGTVQRLINLEGLLPGKRAVILGSGDIGLIMARRMHLEGVDIVGVYEISQTAGGLPRNVQQCLNDYNIKLNLSTTVVEIFGSEALEAVKIAQVDEQGQVILGTEEIIACDLLVLSVGLIPENELTRAAGIKMSSLTSGPVLDQSLMTSVPGIFAAGNVAFVFDLVDYVSLTAEKAAEAASRYIDGERPQKKALEIKTDKNIIAHLPMLYRPDYQGEDLHIYLRVKEEKRAVDLLLSQGGKKIKQSYLPVIRPAEMIAFLLSRKNLDLIKEDAALELSIRER